MTRNALSLDLPPLPTLQREHVRVNSVVTEHGTLEAFVPASAPYLCDDATASTLLLVPGLGLDGLGFIRQLPLGKRTRLHLFQTPNEAFAHGLDSAADYVESYVRASGLDKTRGGLILGGASMGGAISLTLALRGRIKLAGLILVGTYGSCRHLPRFQKFMAPLAYVIPMPLLRKCAWWLSARTGGRISSEEAAWMCRPQIRRTLGYYGRAVKSLTSLQLIERARALTVPTLVIHGSDDNVLPYAAGVELAATISGARLVKVEGARHSLFFTHAKEVNTAAAEFLNEHGK